MIGSGRPGVVFIGPLPPPLHGMAAMNADMVELLAREADVTVLQVGPRRLTRGLRYHAEKSFTAMVAIAGLARARLLGARSVYGSVDAGLGGAWNIIFLRLARMLGMHSFLHHHTYGYLDARTRMMAAVTRAGGAQAMHVVLCEEMERQLRLLYPAVRHVMICGNGIAPPPEVAETPARISSGRPFTIGLLSNLSFAKGVGGIFDIQEQLAAHGIDVHVRLAGPVIEPAVEQLIRERLSRSPDRVKWDGPVHGAAKEAFFAAIDLFVLPSRTESFGLVLIEALMRGVGVIAPAHGCICTMSDLPGAHIVPLDRDFVSSAAATVALIVRGGDQGIEPAKISTAGRALNTANHRSQRALAKRIAAASSR